ncbi:c-type cytochrome [Salinimicrobium oceani]|uniref:Cytochrome c n=1 Tax=Salinimicrobium oceani TaxID=2722702 RepID=A0ABX1CTI5_9FLAO|nr:cytochrome c [Salinimicrobium oceani]NJW51590.1 cytochrome c [Salinimicrobium oceani]
MKKFIFFFLVIFSFSCKNTSNEKTAEVSQQQHSQEMQESMSRGAEIYNNFCASCHLSGGEGISGVFPPLKDSDWLKEQQKASIHAIKFGLKGPIEVNGVAYDNLMPALGLSDRETADVLNYINNTWGNKFGEPVTPEDVAAIEK